MKTVIILGKFSPGTEFMKYGLQKYTVSSVIVHVHGSCFYVSIF
jgi:hypothetical protein